MEGPKAALEGNESWNIVGDDGAMSAQREQVLLCLFWNHKIIPLKSCFCTAGNL